MENRLNSDGLKNGLKTVIMQKNNHKITTREIKLKTSVFFGRKQVINKLEKMQRYGR